MPNPKDTHFSLKHLSPYVKTTHGQGILMSANAKITLQAFSDSDWGSCIDTRKSVTGYIVMLGQSPISWKYKKLSIVSRSSFKDESRAMASTAAQVTWLVRSLTNMKITNLKPIRLHYDNQSTSCIAKNSVFHERTKHIELDCHFTRERS